MTVSTFDVAIKRSKWKSSSFSIKIQLICCYLSQSWSNFFKFSSSFCEPFPCGKSSRARLHFVDVDLLTVGVSPFRTVNYFSGFGGRLNKKNMTETKCTTTFRRLNFINLLPMNYETLIEKNNSKIWMDFNNSLKCFLTLSVEFASDWGARIRFLVIFDGFPIFVHRLKFLPI